MPVHLLNELVKQTPEGIYLAAVKQDGQTVTVTGIAQTHERVSELLRNTAYNSAWLVKPELVESKAATVTGANREQKRLFDFSMRVAVKRPQDLKPADAARRPRWLPSRPASAPAHRRRPDDMATTTKGMNVDLNSVFEGAVSQFRGLNPNEPGQWPMLPKALTWLAVAVAMVVVPAGSCLLSTAHDELDAERAKEPTLKADYRNKLAQAVNLAELRKQKLQVEEYVTQLEKQLPGKAEMDALLSDINQAGLGRGLQFELFRPGPGRRQGLLRRAADRDQGVSGRYHDIGSFAGDVANLSRIVTLHNMTIAVAPRTPAVSWRWRRRRAPIATSTPAELEQIRAANAAKAKAGAKK